MTALETIRSHRIVAILRRVPARRTPRIVDLLLEAGIDVLEVTLDSTDALATIERLGAGAELTVGAGTVRTAAQVDQAASCGAGFCVSPCLVPAIVERCLELGIPPIPGALTPTEIEAAWSAGAPLVKLFPAGQGGSGYVRQVLAPLSDVPLLVTGGVTSANAASFLAAGALAVGVGSALVDADDAVVREEARALVEAVRDPAR